MQQHEIFAFEWFICVLSHLQCVQIILLYHNLESVYWSVCIFPHLTDFSNLVSEQSLFPWKSVASICRNVSLAWVEWVHCFGQIWQIYRAVSTYYKFSWALYIIVHFLYCIVHSESPYMVKMSSKGCSLVGICTGKCILHELLFKRFD